MNETQPTSLLPKESRTNINKSKIVVLIQESPGKLLVSIDNWVLPPRF